MGEGAYDGSALQFRGLTGCHRLIVLHANEVLLLSWTFRWPGVCAAPKPDEEFSLSHRMGEGRGEGKGEHLVCYRRWVDCVI